MNAYKKQQTDPADGGIKEDKNLFILACGSKDFLAI
jgi:hypothetical protein